LKYLKGSFEGFQKMLILEFFDQILFISLFETRWRHWVIGWSELVDKQVAVKIIICFVTYVAIVKISLFL